MAALLGQVRLERKLARPTPSRAGRHCGPTSAAAAEAAPTERAVVIRASAEAAREDREAEAVKEVLVGTAFRRVFPGKTAATDRMVTQELTEQPEPLSFRSTVKRSRI